MPTELDTVRAAVMVAQLWEGERPAPAAAVQLVALILRDCDAENATYRAALQKIASGRDCESHHCSCLGMAKKALGSPSGGDPNG